MANSNNQTNYSLDDLFTSMPIGSLDRAITNNVYGINHRQIPGMVSQNKMMHGLTLFTRPQLNLQTTNIQNVRKMSKLLNENSKSIQRLVRCNLDPILLEGMNDVNGRIPAISCPLVNNKSAFIPYLTNDLLSISGWPDMTINPWSSKPGIYGEVYSAPDSSTENYDAFTLNCTFRNVKGNPTLYTFVVWLMYMGYVFSGDLLPYIKFIRNRRLDFNTRVYRIALESDKRTVAWISCNGASYPISAPVGSMSDFTSETPYNLQNAQFSINLQSMGYIHNDDIVVYNFNKTVGNFNNDMRDDNRDKKMIKIRPELLDYFNNKGYPRIDPDNYTLDWYVENNDFQNVTNALLKTNLGTYEETQAAEEEYQGD